MPQVCSPSGFDSANVYRSYFRHPGVGNIIGSIYNGRAESDASMKRSNSVRRTQASDFSTFDSSAPSCLVYFRIRPVFTRMKFDLQ